MEIDKLTKLIEQKTDIKILTHFPIAFRNCTQFMFGLPVACFEIHSKTIILNLKRISSENYDINQVLFHELGHAVKHYCSETLPRCAEEVCAENVSRILLKNFGLINENNTEIYNTYIKNWMPNCEIGIDILQSHIEKRTNFILQNIFNELVLNKAS